MKRASVVVVALALALAGCPARVPRPMLPPSTSTETLLAGLDARRAGLRSLRARVHFRSGLANVWARQAVLVERPRALRIDVLSPFGLALALGTDGQLLWIYPPQERLRYEGAATPENLARFFGAAVSVDDLVDVLLGVPPRRRATGPIRFEPRPDASVLLTVPIEGGTQRLEFAGRPLQVRSAEETRGGETLVRIEFDDYREGFPRAMDVRAPDGTTARVRYVEVERNPSIDPLVFAAPPAPRVLPLETIQVRR
jgi:hypothetical protein